MIQQNKLLFTGGGGLLGSEIKKLWPKALYPSMSEFDVRNLKQIQGYLKKHKPEIIVHAAAFTSPPIAEKNPVEALETNVVGTANLAKLCFTLGIKMVYICTDYVFSGRRGNYKEDDEVFPVNKYAWSKLGGECAVRMLNDFLIIRTSFGPKVFAYPKAFVDHFTSRESVEVVAGKIKRVVEAGIKGVIHLGHKRRSVYAYAKSLDAKKEIGKVSIKDVDFTVPSDTSLNTSRYNKLFKVKKNASK
ncbi:MAG: sugar nucleotide-binding protein [Candidatus Doudnabacteria bacterium]|nr:sugar nucleotide-binding protein [Candidatus Doudnabacteria bacterium]